MMKLIFISLLMVILAQLNEQSGFNIGTGDMDVTVQGNMYLKSGIIDSKAEASKNHFSTGSLTHENIENHSDVSVQNINAGISSSGPSPMQAIGLAASLLGNVNKNDSSTTQSAVSSNINLTVRDGKTPTTLSRDTENANQTVKAFDKEEYKERAEMAQVIGEISKNAVSMATYEDRMKSSNFKDRAKDAKRDGNKALEEHLLSEAKAVDDKIEARFGMGSPNGQAIAAVTAVLQGLAGDNIGQAVAGGLSPYVNTKIKELTGDNEKANIAAHALWGAIEAQASGNNALAGAAGAAGGELAAKILTEQIYQKDPKDLTASEKETISALSQVVGALSAVAVADNSSDGYRGAETAKSAVENNFFIPDNPHQMDQIAALAIAEQAKASYEETKKQSGEEVQKLVKEVTVSLANIGIDLTPVIGDIKGFYEAEDGIDYALAIFGVVPGSDAITKPLKEAKELYQSAKKAESIGSFIEAKKYQNLADNEVSKSLNGFYDSKEIRESFVNQYGKNKVVSTTIPPGNAKNVKLAGQKHPVTGVPFDNKGFPIFDKFSKYETRLDINTFRDTPYNQQMKLATEDLANSIKRGYIDKNQFTAEQLDSIYKNSDKIPGYTWHHHQDTGRMQLIIEDVHRQTGHVGVAIQGGK